MIELVRKGKRLYGAYMQTTQGLAYVAFRKPDDFFRDGARGEKLTLTQAMNEGRAAWAIDEHTIIAARARGVVTLGVWVKKANWLFITQFQNYLDPNLYYTRSYVTRGGSEQRFLSCKFFEDKLIRVKI